MIPGNAGSVLITGVTPKTAGNEALFNGVFNATVTSGNSFVYSVPNLSVSDSGSGGDVFYGSPGLTFGISNGSTTQGVAINPITSTAALADANATGTIAQATRANAKMPSRTPAGVSQTRSRRKVTR